ncbi:alpha/beta fold hydrolase [Streptomyces djakartensis]|uniref:alpha/beta fold hydrolase n=1 Tax=Streptomyces djakartensis TaxID=68193 RepID=UPI00167E9B11|nr:alpha/beta fold hydrolase [Streptomyces djakartensis]
MSTSADLRNLCDLWLRRYRPSTAPVARLACFPHAGGSASAFLPLIRELPQEIEVLAVQYPGRQDRRAEPLVDSIEQLAAPLADVLQAQTGPPLVLFGHSMGATVAYEVARILEQRGAGPAALVVSGRRAPTVNTVSAVHLYDDDRLIEELRSLDGTDSSLLSDPELLELVLPAIRNDYRAVGHYVHRPGTPLACPLTVLTGADDPNVSAAEAAAWSQVAAADPHVHTWPGGHFFLFERPAEVSAAVVGAIAPVLPPGTPPLPPGPPGRGYGTPGPSAETPRPAAGNPGPVREVAAMPGHSAGIPGPANGAPGHPAGPANGRGARRPEPGAVSGADYVDRRRTAERVRVSADAADSRVHPMAEVPGWLDGYARAHHFHAEPIPFDRLRRWYFEPGTGDLRHESGRFFAVEGLRTGSDSDPADRVQPIIAQPEVGLLGILAHEFDGVLHFLMQAKPEPGNVNGLQLSPTVQATRSNFDEVHHGRPTPFLDWFIQHPGRRVLADSIQSEQADWFLHKHNRNMVVETDAVVEADDAFRWLTLGQIRQLMLRDDLVNMDTRSVLACLPTAGGASHGAGTPDGGEEFAGALRDSFYGEAEPLYEPHAITGCLTDVRALRILRQQSVPLEQAYAHGWERTETTIRHRDGRHFEIMAVEVNAERREVASWTQPLLRPCSQGLVALITRRFDGVLHALVAARSGAGTLNVAEFGPSVQCRPAELSADAPPYLDYVRACGTDRIRYDVIHSEEGGRFYHARNRYLVIEAGAEIPADCPPGFRWATFGQLTELLAHGNYLNVELRTLITCAHATY